MTKLDLSALKKQKTISEATPAVTAIPSVVTVEPAPAAMPAAVNPVKTADAPLGKPKLSLSSFKKPGSVTGPAPVAMPAAVETVASAELEPASVGTTVEAVESIVPESVPAIQSPEPVVAIVEPVAVQAAVEIEPTMEPVAEPTVEVETGILQSVQEEENVTPSSSEFFPNLALENDNLFSDIVGMGSFEEEKEEPVAEVTEPATAIETVMETVSPVAEAAPSEVVVTTEPTAKSEYVESVAKELSKERKGGLSELFDKKRKVFFGITALVVASVGVVGSLYGFGVLEGSKASIAESRPVEVTMEKKPTPKPRAEGPAETRPKDGTAAELPPPIAPGKATASGVTVVVTPVVAHTGSVVAQPPVTSSGTVVASASGTTIAPAVPVNSSVNTLRTPNVRKKRSE